MREASVPDVKPGTTLTRAKAGGEVGSMNSSWDRKSRYTTSAAQNRRPGWIHYEKSG